ncbi:MAG: hypothetical protein ABIQ40_00930 [Bacteroidia bacterium]
MEKLPLWNCSLTEIKTFCIAEIQEYGLAFAGYNICVIIQQLISEPPIFRLLKFTHAGIYCRHTDVYIDPWKPADKAIIRYAHSDVLTHSEKPIPLYLLERETAAEY